MGYKIRMAICYLYWCILRLNKYDSSNKDEFKKWKAASAVNLTIFAFFGPFILFGIKYFDLHFTNSNFLIIAVIFGGSIAWLIHRLVLSKFSEFENSFLCLSRSDRRDCDIVAGCVVCMLVVWFYVGLTSFS